MKSFKDFARRKSAGNVLEAFDNKPQQESSFRVFTRPEVERAQTESPRPAQKSLDGANKLAFWNTKGQKREKQDPFASQKGGATNRGSGGSNTTHSASTNGYTDANSSSSARLSSSSTVPSSTEDQHDTISNGQPPIRDIPLPPLPKDEPVFQLRAAGRTFSFGSRAPKPSIPSYARQSSDEDGYQDQPQTQRERGMTESSYASTATPPKLETMIGTPEGLGTSFGDMFGNIGKDSGAQHSPLPFPASADRARDIGSSPISWNSHHSNDAFILSPTNDAPAVPRHGPIRGLTSNNNTSLPSPTNRRGGLGLSGLGQAEVNNSKSSLLMEDEDAKLVAESYAASRALGKGDNNLSGGISPSIRQARADPSSTLFDSDDLGHSSSAGRRDGSNMTTPKAQFSQPLLPKHSQSDTNTSKARGLTTQFEEASNGRAANGTGKKVMTPAQFERYRRESEISRHRSDASESGDSDGPDAYEDEDEIERNRQIARQRRKQEAHLAVYRQQMMKVTGDQHSQLPNLGHAREASASTPNLLSGLSNVNLSDEKLDSHRKQSEDEDDDVPLAILQAHGFPSKNRPPSQFGGPSPSIRAPSQLGTYHPPPASVSGAESVATNQRHSNLPVFARGLPQDPYYGSGLITQPNRHSVAVGQQQPGFVSGNAPPGGLIGVIAEEERARAIRRGSPNANTTYDSASPSPQNFHQGPLQTQSPMSMQMPGMMPGMVPNMMPGFQGDQATAHISAQMQQMMQMQMQWMQQMMQMQGMQVGQNAPLVDFTGTQQVPTMNPGFATNQRPASMLNMPSMQNGAGPYRHSYASSIHSGTSPNQGYAASMAPSERSNVGMPSRYRPVSQIPNVSVKAPSTVGGSSPSWEKSNPIAAIRPIGNRKSSGSKDDEDDEEAWEEMKKKKEKKRSMWKRKKEPDSLADMNYTKFH